MIKIVLPWGKILIIALITHKLQPHSFYVLEHLRSELWVWKISLLYEHKQCMFWQAYMYLGFGKFQYLMCTNSECSGEHTCILCLENVRTLCAQAVNAH